jgi:hypothetical protein
VEARLSALCGSTSQGGRWDRFSPQRLGIATARVRGAVRSLPCPALLASTNLRRSYLPAGTFPRG